MAKIPKPPRRADINGAARTIAAILDAHEIIRSENDVEKRLGLLNVTWRLLDASQTIRHIINLECRNGYSADGAWWAGHVEVRRIDDPNDPPVVIASQRLLEPWGQSRGDIAKKATRHAFCGWATKFGKL